MIHLQAVADYLRTGRAMQALKALLARRKPIINFDVEIENRPRRYIEVTKAYRDGMPITDIMKTYGCSKSTVHRYARMAGLHRPKESSVRDGILAMYQLGKPVAQIAAHFGVSPALVSRYAVDAGLSRYKNR